jgi:ABC-type transport system involved in cytochrome c biogenesis permease subunit
MLASLLAVTWWVVALVLLGRISPPFLDFIESSGVTTQWTSLTEVLRGTSAWTPFVAPGSTAASSLVSQPVAVLATTLVAAGGLAGLALRSMPARGRLVTMLMVGLVLLTAGYAGGLLTAVISFVYVFLRGFGLDGGDRDLRRSLTKVVYGCVCLTLLLSLTGTVLGGIWANDSWGRFWGWDPKENGALMIVLWNLVILHARLGGYIKEWGLHFCALFGSCVVAFSWWHVNFFNTGLHTYGFTNDKQLMLWVFYYFIMTVIAFGFIARGIEISRKNAETARATSPPIPKVPELL